MNFNDSSNKENSLYHDTLFILGLSSSDTTTFAVDPDFTRAVNKWLRKVNSWIWQSDRNWEYDDRNNTDYPIATTTLVDDQHDYTFPTDIHKVTGVSVKDSAGNYLKLKPIDRTQVSIDLTDEFMKTKSMPIWYDLNSYSVWLYPAPDTTNSTTATAGLKIYFSRGIKSFATTDTAVAPGFDSNYHEVLSVGAGIEYAKRTTMRSKLREFKREIEEYKKNIQEHYGSRSQEFVPQIRRKIQRYN